MQGAQCQCVRNEENFGSFGMRQPLGPIRLETANPCQIRERCPLVFPPEFKSLSLPFSPPACFCHVPKGKGGAGFLESPAPYGGILSTRVVGIFPRTSFPTARYLPAVASGAPHVPSPYGQKLRFWLICLTAVGSFVLQVWDSASSRLLADFHRSTHIASVVPHKWAQQLFAAPMINLNC